MLIRGGHAFPIAWAPRIGNPLEQRPFPLPSFLTPSQFKIQIHVVTAEVAYIRSKKQIPQR